jgi:hypothetical protein
MASDASLFGLLQRPRRCSSGSELGCARRCWPFQVQTIPSVGRDIPSMHWAFRVETVLQRQVKSLLAEPPGYKIPLSKVDLPCRS